MDKRILYINKGKKKDRKEKEDPTTHKEKCPGCRWGTL